VIFEYFKNDEPAHWPRFHPLIEELIPFRLQGCNIALVGAHLRVRPKSGQTRGSAPTEIPSLAHWTENSYYTVKNRWELLAKALLDQG